MEIILGLDSRWTEGEKPPWDKIQSYKISTPYYYITVFRHPIQEKCIWNPAQERAQLLQKDDKCRGSVFYISNICTLSTDIKGTQTWENLLLEIHALNALNWIIGKGQLPIAPWRKCCLTVLEMALEFVEK